MSEREEIKKSSGNVFADVGLPPESLFKAHLARRIAQVVTKKKLTQTETAAILGVDQPKVSALMRGKLQGFSVDRLFHFLNALGQDVEVNIRSARSKRRGSVTVVR